MSKRSFSRPGGVQTEIGSGSGKSYYVDGTWYVAIHGTLLAVNTSGL